jgi:hypothetical protein
MRKTSTLLSLLLSFAIISCTREDSCLTGKVRFNNLSSNPYNLYVDGIFKDKISGSTFKDYDLPAGDHVAKAEQVSGYLLYPTIRNWDFNLTGCADTLFSFP